MAGFEGSEGLCRWDDSASRVPQRPETAFSHLYCGYGPLRTPKDLNMGFALVVDQWGGLSGRMAAGWRVCCRRQDCAWGVLRRYTLAGAVPGRPSCLRWGGGSGRSPLPDRVTAWTSRAVASLVGPVEYPCLRHPLPSCDTLPHFTHKKFECLGDFFRISLSRDARHVSFSSETRFSHRGTA